jgi:hypothetical protein
MQAKRMAYLSLIVLITFSTSLFAQVEKVKPVFFDGVINVGYINNGGFLNFTGPGLSASYKNSKFLFGMLPSLRFRVDNDTPKNAAVFPNLGFGLTYSYKYLSIQVPMYYNTKTETEDGSWHVGFGIGYRIGAFNKKN